MSAPDRPERPDRPDRPAAQRPSAAEVEEVLAWTGTPLATQEVAVVCDIAFAEARERLGRVAHEQHLGADGLWTLPPAKGDRVAAATAS